MYPAEPKSNEHYRSITGVITYESIKDKVSQFNKLS